jgi:hypothetical protein
MSMSQTAGGSGEMIIPLHPDAILDTASGSKSPSGVTAGVVEGLCGVPEQITLFEEELWR